jgi:EpsI family protein
MPLQAPLDTAISSEIVAHRGTDVAITAEEQTVAGMDDYLLRLYEPLSTEAGPGAFSLYVGYYESQLNGRTIHSPKNCLPGAGWEPLTSSVVRFSTSAGDVIVNRYLLQRGTERTLVLYWYQGRGRVEPNEYVVKWDLLRDSALRQRSDEALVRVMVPVTDTEEAALELAGSVVQEIVPAVYRAVPS